MNNIALFWGLFWVAFWSMSGLISWLKQDRQLMLATSVMWVISVSYLIGTSAAMLNTWLVTTG